MSRLNPTDLPAHMAVLGLVIEQPNQTVSHIAQALDERFQRARFVQSTAHGTLPQMARGRSVRVRCTYRAPGDERSMDRYAPTERGLKIFHAWMFQPPGGVPAIREALYGRIELARLAHLPRLISIAREEERIATDLYAAASERVRKHEIRRRSGAARTTPGDYERKIRETLLYVDPLHWSSRAELFVVIAERLEEIAEEAGVQFAVSEEAGMDLEASDG
jgi:hypothetical protein